MDTTTHLAETDTKRGPCVRLQCADFSQQSLALINSSSFTLLGASGDLNFVVRNLRQTFR